MSAPIDIRRAVGEVVWLQCCWPEGRQGFTGTDNGVAPIRPEENSVNHAGQKIGFCCACS